LIVFGGQDGEKVFGDLIELDLPSLEWFPCEFPGPAPSPRFAHAALFSTTQMWLFGGKNQDTYMNDFYCCDMYEAMWFKITTQAVPEPRAWHSAFWIYKGDLPMFSIFGGAARSSALGGIWSFDYDDGDWYCPAIEGDAPGPRYAHVSVVFDNKVYIIGGRSMKDKPQEPYRVNLGVTPYRSELLPQTEEPSKLLNGSACAIPKFGLMLCGGGIWRIRLTPKEESIPVPRLVSKPVNDVISRPTFNVSSDVVSAIAGSSKQFAFSRGFDRGKLESIGRESEEGWKWRASMVVFGTIEKIEGEDDHGRLLPESDFVSEVPATELPEKKKKRTKTLAKSPSSELPETEIGLKRLGRGSSAKQLYASSDNLLATPEDSGESPRPRSRRRDSAITFGPGKEAPKEHPSKLRTRAGSIAMTPHELDHLKCHHSKHKGDDG
jgi:hypothetical protein